jgi:hypothetical protein
MGSTNEYNSLEESSLLKGEKPPKHKIKMMKVFDYEVLGNVLTASEEAVSKIYPLLGKKFALHDIQYEIHADDITISNEGTYTGVIKEILDWGNSKYYLVSCSNQDLIVSSKDDDYQIGEEIHFDISSDKMGVYDIDFGVKLI